MPKNTFIVFFIGFSIGALILGIMKGEFNWSSWGGMVLGLTLIYVITNILKK